MTTANAYWNTGPRRGEVREERLPDPGPGQALVRTLHSGISRGTESIVHAARVPEAVRISLRAPHQSGDWPGPVKFGYLNVGVVEAGPPELVGERVFCLFPHQDRYVIDAADLVVLPPELPSHRAVLAGTMETAVNAVWDARPAYGDRIAVIGAGMVGAMVAGLLRQFPLARLELVDVNPDRAALAEALGVRLVEPGDASPECDIVVHCSATAAGLATGLRLLANEGELIEMSWYGDNAPEVPLGETFHSRRLSIRASQVGQISPTRRGRRSYRDRLELSMEALCDDRYEHFVSGRSAFADIVATMDRVCTGSTEICHVVDY
ncbi:MDR/zinc-dependent alcohol dehydrogenase-like family protein [Cumulibacter manganitolerans]|uniref:dehydrogenase n=1 Tax=Cumulibacter manganitolerans TaxID=1884992 RepID=UPI0012957CE1|nr:dehydrogenase [Cumulibacter manganitolerans]